MNFETNGSDIHPSVYDFSLDHRLVGLVVKASAESGRSRVRNPLAPGFFRGRVIPVT